MPFKSICIRIRPFKCLVCERSLRITEKSLPSAFITQQNIQTGFTVVITIVLGERKNTGGEGGEKSIDKRKERARLV